MSGSSSSDTDSAFEEEVVVQRYLKQDLKSGLAQGKALLRHHDGVKPQPGHYKLRDCCHAVVDHKAHGYQGKHWETSKKSGNLEKATRRLTTQAVDQEMDHERKRRAKREEELSQMAKAIIQPLLEQFNDTLIISQREMAAEQRLLAHQQESVKDSVQCELVCKENAKRVDKMAEEERQYQVKLLLAMKDDAMRTASIDSLVDSMAVTNQKRSLINTDLEEASERLQEDQQELDVEYNKACGEMLDQSLITVVQESHRDLINEQEEQARKEKMEFQEMVAKDKVASHYKHKFSKAVKKIAAMYKELEMEEKKEAETLMQKAEDVKFTAQEDIVRIVNTKVSSKLVHEEKVRRIKEEEQMLNEDNPARTAMMNLMNRVQRQMLLQKFKGKWVNITQKKKESTAEKQSEDNLSEQDKKLRRMRTKNRKETKIVSWQNEEM
uniref:Trichohyalin-like n=1 Tax=Crassostrea virginica TaxID=6565 RepID=A0A8B8C3B8_CRAVI|nr:trichohyalin-like [Crassostrea virginica]